MLEARRLYKSYDNGADKLEVLKGVDLKIDKAQTVAILGPSGAGKSTLLHLLGGLDRPTSGEVHIDNVDIYSLRERERARLRNRKIGFIFQFYHLLPEFDALENVMFPLRIKGERVCAARSAAKKILETVGLGGRSSHLPNQLSGGEQQRVAIARALVNEPEILLCDEPTGNLDSNTGRNVIELLLDLNRTRKLTLVVVTHDNEIAKAAQRVLHIKDGRIGG